MLDSGDASEVAKRYSLGDGAVLTGPVARGEQGEVWRLSTSRGIWAVKESFEEQSEAEAKVAADFQDAARAVGVPSPRLVRAVNGDVVVNVRGAPLRVYGWVDLLEPDVGLDPVAVGELLASIHRVRAAAEDSSVDPWYTDPVGIQRWNELVTALSVAGAPYAGTLADLREQLVDLETLLERSDPVQICHRDLWADNLRATPGGGLCVIDWENSGPADQSQELALVLFEFGGQDVDRVRALYESYLLNGGPGRIDRRGHFSMVIAQLGHIAEMACQQWLEAATADEQERSVRRFAEFASLPMTTGLIDEMIATVASRRRPTTYLA
jgi:aminoglycoside phosphotransferase (APT) family kinase protein